MDYSIRQVELTEDVGRQVTDLVNLSFPDQAAISETRIRDNTTVPGGPPSVYMAAVIGEEIIGFNAFIGHQLWLNGEPLTAYQSCWTATSEAHRGKKIFQNLIGAGLETTRAQGAAFMMGYPNANSRPLFVHKLGFREIGGVAWQMPLVPVLRNRWLVDSPKAARADHILQDEAQLILWKRAQHGEDLLVVEHGPSILWGIRRTAARAKVKLFQLGGLDLKSPDDLRPLLRTLYKRVRGALFLKFESNEGNHYNNCFSRLRPSLPPLIIQDLSMDTQGMGFSFFGGIRDYF